MSYRISGAALAVTAPARRIPGSACGTTHVHELLSPVSTPKNTPKREKLKPGPKRVQGRKNVHVMLAGFLVERVDEDAAARGLSRAKFLEGRLAELYKLESRLAELYAGEVTAS